ncbi:hypothetical protein [Mediterranea sp. An20]|uniref:lipopolysaccharide biosynthesis protein n=1 Tax=Mediterranea sp. An20 TaxID=1965586 RepID=UPI0011245A3D|nr:hypothetical protein [Mediterranea sp. An20]
MSRTEQSLKNFRISSVFLGISIIFNFVSRSIFIKYLGADVVGLSSTLLNILGFLNLAELGLTSAISGTLYELIYKKDESRIKDVISIFGFLYRIIGVTILVLGIIISFFLVPFFSESGLPDIYIVGGYYTFLLANLVGYFISYKQTLLVADQREYIVTSFTYGAQTLKFACQIVALKYLGYGYVVWLGIELFWGIIYGIAINRIVKKKYPWLVTSYHHGKEIYRNYATLFRTIKQVIPHNISAFVLNQSTNILIYVFSSLVKVTIYTNYTMILVRFVSVLNICMRGITASFGNLVAEGNKAKILSIFFQFNALFFIIGGVVCTTCYYQIESFIKLWLGAEYVLDRWIFLLMLYIMYVGIVRLPINYFIGAYVLYKDTWAPMAEACINLFVAIVFGHLLGIGGVVLGGVISLSLIVVLWKPFFLFRNGFCSSVGEYWQKVLKYLVVLFPISLMPQVLFQHNLLKDNSTVVGFSFNTLVIAFCLLIVYSIVLYIIDKPTKGIVRRIYKVIFHKC